MTAVIEDRTSVAHKPFANRQLDRHGITVPLSRPRRAAPVKVTIEELCAMRFDELLGCYRMGDVPDTLRSLDGTPRGRVLALAGPLGRGRVASLVRRVVTDARFPWLGKSFFSSRGDSGSGINRVRLLGQREVYPFATSVEPSSIDGRPCIRLDYDRTENPLPIRLLRDELREVSPGLFLGPALVQALGRFRPVLMFAVDKGSAR